MPGQPQFPGTLTFDATLDVINAAGEPSGFVINVGEMVSISTTVQITGTPLFTAILKAALNNPAVQVKVTHHLQNLHTGINIEQAGGISSPGAANTFVVNSPLFTLPLSPVPTNPDETPYRVLTVVQAGGPLTGLVAAFIEGPVMMVVAP